MNTVLKVAERLEKRGYSTRVVNLHTINPIDKELLLSCGKETNAVISIEEQSMKALGGAASQALASSLDAKVPFMSLDLNHKFQYISGDQHYLLEKAGLSEDKIYSSVIKFISNKKNLPND